MPSVLDHVRLYRNAYLLAASAAMGSIFYGWDIGLIGGVISMKSFQADFGVDKMSKSEAADFNGNIVSVLQGGSLYVPVSSSRLPAYHESDSRPALAHSLPAISPPDLVASLRSLRRVLYTSSVASSSLS